jgi:putative membrane protein
MPRSRSAHHAYNITSEGWRKMARIANIIVGLLALLHGYILVLEMFFWESPMSLRAFGLTPELAKATVAMGANQGLYNGFLAAGFAWSLSLDPAGRSVKTFFLLCVLVAGIFGATTVSSRIFFIQAVPAALGLFFLWQARPA